MLASCGDEGADDWRATHMVASSEQNMGLKGKRESLDVAFDGADENDEDLNCIRVVELVCYRKSWWLQARINLCVLQV